MEDHTTPRYQSQDALVAEQQKFIGSVYAWLAAGLATSGTMAYFVSVSDALQSLILPVFGNPYTLILPWLGLFWMIGRCQDMVLELPVSQATAIYFLYWRQRSGYGFPLFSFFTHPAPSPPPS